MNDHNLDDLIIDNIAPKNRKTKSFLTIIALFIVVLIVAIVLTRTLLKTPDSDTLTLEEDMTEHIAPELKLQEKPQKVQREEKPSLQMIIEEEPKAPAVKKQETKTPKPTPIELPKIEEKMPAPIKVEKKEVPIVKKPLEVQKTVTQKPIPKEPIVQKPAINQPQAVSTIQYYIQVGSFSKDPSARFLSVIKNSGFRYQVTQANLKGIKKLHIGPYKTRSEADVALKQVKDRINKNAFVIQK